MLKLRSYEFRDNNNEIRENNYGLDWPVVYVLENGKQVYIGETNSLYNRVKQHYKDKKFLKRVHMITDKDFNKSAILDIESALIKYMVADNKFEVINKNNGLSDSLYYDKEFYKSKIPVIWRKLKENNLANKEIIQIENSDLFKYSPYKALTEDQDYISQLILDDILNSSKSKSFVEGNPGTGKTILAVYLLKLLEQNEKIDTDKIAIVVPMTSLRQTLKKVLKSINGLKAAMVIGPSEVIKKEYDVLIIDEAHRLKRRVNLTSYKSFDDVNIKLGLEKDKGTELDWIELNSNHQVYFYDENQSIKPSDVLKNDFLKLKTNATNYTLYSQHRVFAGEEYINYIKNIFAVTQEESKVFDNYDMCIYNNFKDLREIIINKDNEFGLSRIVSGYSFEWISKKDNTLYDVVLDDVKMQWNTTDKDWVNSKNAINEVGCIHTVQGYDINYVGVILGNEIDYDFTNNKIVIYKNNYYDIKGKSKIESDEQLLDYIKNIYVTLFTRGIRGIYLYVCNDNMKKYLQQYFKTR